VIKHYLKLAGGPGVAREKNLLNEFFQPKPPPPPATHECPQKKFSPIGQADKNNFW